MIGRKIYHTLGGLFLLGAYHLAGPARAFVLYAVLFGIILAFDLARLRIPSFNRWALRRMRTLIRPNEADTLTGSPAYIVGVAMTLFLFDKTLASAAVLFLVFGDTCASIVGESWGRPRFRGKSLEGTAAFVGAALLAGAALRALGGDINAVVLISGVTTAAAVEVLTPGWINDNLSIPLASAAAMTLTARLAG